MRKIEIDKNLHLGPNYGKYDKVKKIKVDVNYRQNLQKINTFKIILMTAFFVLLFFAFFLFLTRQKEIIPQKNEPIEESFQTEVSETNQPIDSETGYPIYNETDYLYLVNKKSPIKNDLEIELIDFKNIKINIVMQCYLQELIDNAKKDNIDIALNKGYVSPEEQTILFDKKLQNLIILEGYTKVMANAKAEFFVPKANESDMQSGLCLEIIGNKETFEKTNTYSWLVKNSATYGFVFRYPTSKQNELESEANPLILRYVGVENAIKMRQLSMCLEEYVNYLN